jgi:hypothetical protein
LIEAAFRRGLYSCSQISVSGGEAWDQPQSQSHTQSPGLNWLFVDLNSYFASVEQQVRPDLRGRPIAVVPMMADTTVCIAASYEAWASSPLDFRSTAQSAKDRHIPRVLTDVASARSVSIQSILDLL